ncbi:TubC N-terminal docking domain-related protein [Paraburkholderia adhaesiva]|uniref:TubC N-terminal docking domain-related protein n=1 Tax=Paraburkholderia adhaesiva TaxID=2883244 RepID=UPI001F26CA2D|nr:hypothetical protein [Paraburkholderia adhaesiva]
MTVRTSEATSNVAQILSKAESLGVRLSLLDSDRVHMAGPKEARDALRGDVIAHKPEIIAYLRETANDPAHASDDCTGALGSDDGALCLPWGPRIDTESVNQMRAELVGMIETLADLEGWPHDLLNDVVTRAMRGPLADLLPNLHHFRERLDTARTEAQAREATAARSWRANEALENRGYPDGNATANGKKRGQTGGTR